MRMSLLRRLTARRRRLGDLLDIQLVYAPAARRPQLGQSPCAKTPQNRKTGKYRRNRRETRTNSTCETAQAQQARLRVHDGRWIYREIPVRISEARTPVPEALGNSVKKTFENNPFANPCYRRVCPNWWGKNRKFTVREKR